MTNTECFHRLRRNEDTTLCRKCLNKRFDLNLKREDCRYNFYTGQCSECQKVKNIVTGVAILKRWKLWGKKPKA